MVEVDSPILIAFGAAACTLAAVSSAGGRQVEEGRKRAAAEESLKAAASVAVEPAFGRTWNSVWQTADIQTRPRKAQAALLKHQLECCLSGCQTGRKTIVELESRGKLVLMQLMKL